MSNPALDLLKLLRTGTSVLGIGYAMARLESVDEGGKTFGWPTSGLDLFLTAGR